MSEILSAKELQALFREVLDEELPRHFELIGLGSATEDARAEVRKDLAFARKMRIAMDSVEIHIGRAILWGVGVIVAALFLAGVQTKFGKF